MTIASASAALVTAVNDFGASAVTKVTSKASKNSPSFTGRAVTVPVAVAFSQTPTFNPALSNVFNFAALTNNVTGPIFPAGADGQTINIFFKQDTFGARSVTLPSNVKADGAIELGANRLTMLILTWRDAEGLWVGNWNKVVA